MKWDEVPPQTAVSHYRKLATKREHSYLEMAPNSHNTLQTPINMTAFAWYIIKLKIAFF